MRAGWQVPPTVTCLATGKWDFPEYGYVALECSATLVAPANGAVSLPRGVTGVEAVYSCNAGFVLNGSATTVCQADGAWLPAAAPTCDQLACPPLTAPADGTVSVVGSVATFACNAGFQLIGPSAMGCEFGEWNATVLPGHRCVATRFDRRYRIFFAGSYELILGANALHSKALGASVLATLAPSLHRFGAVHVRVVSVASGSVVVKVDVQTDFDSADAMESLVASNNVTAELPTGVITAMAVEEGDSGSKQLSAKWITLIIALCGVGFFLLVVALAIVLLMRAKRAPGKVTSTTASAPRTPAPGVASTEFW